MSSKTEDDEDFSGSDADSGFEDDMEALRRACIVTGKNPNDLKTSSAITVQCGTTSESDDEDDDIELVRRIQQRFSSSTDVEATLFLKPLSTLPPAGSDDEDDDFETLRAIQRRFGQYGHDSREHSKDNYLHKPEQVSANNIALQKEPSNNLFADSTNVGEGNLDCVDGCNITQNLGTSNDNIPGTQPPGLIEWHQSGAHNFASSPPRYSSFPKSAQAFVDAIKRNRSCQKFLRSKLIQIEARIEENKKLKDRVKILKDFQVTCRKRTGRALSQKKDARVQLISVVKQKANSKVNEKKVPAMYYGPAENSHVASYRMALKKFPLSLSREKWSKEEKENLAKGIKQQFQELLLQKSVDAVQMLCGVVDLSVAFMLEHEQNGYCGPVVVLKA
ncbi:hypothetical protein F0562_023936 [Nyssa sinensis]|uniref:Uncharacterized protein n=1 Tax=Nyssa sinensis TaxID=561372 RepID=A0A5J5BJ86_9ASTE|nr:hypothetical protein F0562_023936 [Nyssa sinensis]